MACISIIVLRIPLILRKTLPPNKKVSSNRSLRKHKTHLNIYLKISKPFDFNLFLLYQHNSLSRRMHQSAFAALVFLGIPDMRRTSTSSVISFLHKQCYGFNMARVLIIDVVVKGNMSTVFNVFEVWGNISTVLRFWGTYQLKSFHG